MVRKIKIDDFEYELESNQKVYGLIVIGDTLSLILSPFFHKSLSYVKQSPEESGVLSSRK